MISPFIFIFHCAILGKQIQAKFFCEIFFKKGGINMERLEAFEKMFLFDSHVLQ